MRILNSKQAMVIILIIRFINKAITIILLILAPKIIIISGPKATLGNELIIVKNGSIISDNIGNS